MVLKKYFIILFLAVLQFAASAQRPMSTTGEKPGGTGKQSDLGNKDNVKSKTTYKQIGRASCRERVFVDV